MLKIENLKVRYGMIDAVKGVDLAVETGEIVTLIGANGAGKSSLINAISRLAPVSSGSILLNGRPIHMERPEKIVSQGVIQVPEGRQIFTQMTVRENLMMGAYCRRRNFQDSDLNRVLKLFPRLEERQTQLSGLMSGGEQQMLAIGRALMGNPKLLLLDEPSMGLAPLIIADIFGVIRNLREQLGCTILLVEQNARAALRLADRGYVLTTGTVTAKGASKQLLQDETVQEAFLGHASGGNGGQSLKALT